MTRKAGVYSSAARTEWVNTQPVFSKRELLIKSYQVMQRWESNYMKSLAAVATSCGGNVLEVGFGMGISARFIQQSKTIRSHSIIECHPTIVSHAARELRNEIKAGRVRLLHGFWEQVTRGMGAKSFDGILFDSCPLESGVEFFQFFPFFKEAFRLLKDDGVFTYFSDEPLDISKPHLQELRKAGFANVGFKICRVRPPKTCEYWKHDTLVVPIVRKHLPPPRGNSQHDI